MSTEVKAKRVANFAECNAPGEFYITAPNPAEGHMRRLSFRCPCGCGDLCGIRVRDDGKNAGGAWGWDKNEDSPTCTPSIDVKAAVGSHWHGYLTAGVFRSC
jgi:hypothetical protein